MRRLSENSGLVDGPYVGTDGKCQPPRHLGSRRPGRAQLIGQRERGKLMPVRACSRSPISCTRA